MDIGKPLIEYGAVDSSELREKMLCLPQAFWEIDKPSRVRIAGGRAGNAVFFFNDVPPCVSRNSLYEAQTTGRVGVLRYVGRPLFAEIQRLIDGKIKSCFPACDVLRAQLVELPPGGVIEPHSDRNILAIMHRLHVPIVTHPAVKFTIAGGHYFLKADTLYDLNNTVVHAVENRSDVMRVHLLVDMLPNSVARARYFDSPDEMVAALGA